MSEAWVAKGTVLSRVGQHHLAFFRGYLEGLDLKDLSIRYLETADSGDVDLRVAKSVLRWVRDELMVAARRQGQHSYARLVNISRESLPQNTTKMPSLEEYQAEVDPDGFYSESELLEMFQSEFSGKIDRKSKRNARLRERQMQALGWLENLLAVPPLPSDPVETWIDTHLSKRLHQAGITTLQELVDHINAKGNRWYAKVPRFGQKAADRVLKWLHMNAKTLGVAIGRHVTVKNSQITPAQRLEWRPKETGIVPMEYLIVPHELDGKKGANRADLTKNQLNASNDYEAIHAWLDTLASRSQHTYRAYKKEAERFLLWSLFEAQKPLSSLRVEDCTAYREFLNDLGTCGEYAPPHIQPPPPWRFRTPQSMWIGQRHVERMSPEWKPFEGALTLRSQKSAQTIVASLFSWLCKKRYLDANPWDGLPPKLAGRPKVKIEHSFTFAQWRYLMSYLDAMDRTPHYYRLRFVLFFLYATGLRLFELNKATYGDFTRIVDPDNFGGWTIKVLGKGKKERKVPVPNAIMAEVNAYLAHRGYHPQSNPPKDETPLIGKLVVLNKDQKPIAETETLQKLAEAPADKRGARHVRPGISNMALYQMLKQFFEEAAEKMPSLEEKNHIEKASTHWLRHTCGTHAAAREVPVDVLKELFGHASIETTSMYINAETKRQLDHMSRFVEESLQNAKISASET